MITRLDTLLGNVTMYRQLVYTLAVLQLLAILFSALGLVGVAGPLEMIVSFAVLFVSTGLINLVLAVTFRIRTHKLSSLITAQLLFFVVAPPHLDEPLLLVAVAVAGAIAVASKYLLAIRGRHVVNPAAFGTLVVVALSAVIPTWGIAVWWVATDWMLPFVVIGGVLILFRTRRLPMGGVFVAVATLAGLGFYVFLGTPPLDAVRPVLVSSPILFLGGFMLSEPLTLPPRRWQQMVYAVIVGVLMWGTVWIPVVGNHPEFALVIANVVAFLFGQRRGIQLVFAGKRQLSPTSWELDFTPKKPVTFRSGQFMELTVPHTGTDSRGWRRVFSIASAPGGTVRFGTKLPERSSSFKRALLDLTPGTHVTATAVGGDFLLPADPKTPLLLVAGGIGITPFIGSLELAAAERGSRDIVVVYAVSSTADLAYSDLLEGAGCQVILASPEKPKDLPSTWTWIGPGRVTGESLLAAVPDAVNREAFLSGPPMMVSALRHALRSAGVRRVHTDVFVGY